LSFFDRFKTFFSLICFKSYFFLHFLTSYHKEKQSLGKKPQQGEKMINNQSRLVRRNRQYEPENTWNRDFTYANKQKMKGSNEPWWYDEK